MRAARGRPPQRWSEPRERRRGGLLALGLALLSASGTALGQGPAQPWRRVETRHFRVYYPAPAEAWSRALAGRLEAIRLRVVADVGYDPDEVVDLLVMDPVAKSNGSAWPLLGSPRMVLWPTPPGPDDILGDYTSWPVTLALHEDVHLVHLLRPSRNPLQRLVEAIVPLGPIAERAPRWVVEGYATQLEGRLTGAGRPHSDLRAAIIRRWAQQGELPGYDRLSADSNAWLGMSMAYLVGSAYLDWLEERTGPDSLRHLWRRLTARADRSFDQAFAGVFGDSPRALYGRFTAEVTWKAVEVEHELAPTARDGELWQRLTWATGAPALSRDGSLLAIVLRDREVPPRIVVWSTAPDEEAVERWESRHREELARDPEDVPAVRSRPFPRQVRWELPTIDGAAPEQPRFMPDGRSILLVRSVPDADGVLHPDLFVWSFLDAALRRVTRGASVRDADPGPDGTWAVAVRSIWGATQLVRVDLVTGEVEAITSLAVDDVTSGPRVSPDGSLVAFTRHREGRWRLMVRDLESGSERELRVPPAGVPMRPAWQGDGSAVLASVGHEGLIDLFSFPLEGGSPAQVTRSLGAALAPAPSGDDVFFLALEAHGLDLRRLAMTHSEVPLPAVEVPVSLAPVVPVAAGPAPPPLARSEVPPAQPYGAGRQELRVLVGGRVAPSGRAVELGLRLGDVVGRSDLLAMGSVGSDAGPRGGALGWAWRGWPITVEVHAFRAEERPSRQPDSVPFLGEGLDAVRSGIEAALARRREWLGGAAEARAGLYFGGVDPVDGGGRRGERVAFLEIVGREGHASGIWGISGELQGRVDGGRTEGTDWHRWMGRLDLAGWRGASKVLVTWRRGACVDPPTRFERFAVGGLPGSLLPSSVLASRVTSPALPRGSLLGDRYEGQRLSLLVGGGAVSPFYERHRVWRPDTGWTDWLAVAGLAVDVDAAPMPLLGLPAFTVRAGAARVLDAPFEGDVQWWLGVAWHP